MQTWDEFNPALYRLTATLTTGGDNRYQTDNFGMREFKADGKLLLLMESRFFCVGQ
jgi:beta-galactosidase/beta-glucuronidase